MFAVHDVPQPTPQPTSTQDVAPPPTPLTPAAERTIPTLTVIRPGTEPPTPAPATPASVKSWATGTAAPWLSGMFLPPDIVKQDRPSLQKIHRYGKGGTQTLDNGPLRLVSRAWSWFALYHTARGYLRGWLMERPVRGVVFTTLVITAAYIPETRAVLTVVLWPAHEVIDLLTNY
jgi:hypothetical protein